MSLTGLGIVFTGLGMNLTVSRIRCASFSRQLRGFTVDRTSLSIGLTSLGVGFRGLSFGLASRRVFCTSSRRRLRVKCTDSTVSRVQCPCLG